MLTVKAACDACGSTGLYSGMCEGPGRAVICLDCDGTGCMEIRYSEYRGRKRKPGIKTIQQSRGRFIAGPIGGGGKEMTYDDFKRAVPAKDYA